MKIVERTARLANGQVGRKPLPSPHFATVWIIHCHHHVCHVSSTTPLIVSMARSQQADISLNSAGAQDLVPHDTQLICIEQCSTYARELRACGREVSRASGARSLASFISHCRSSHEKTKAVPFSKKARGELVAHTVRTPYIQET